MKKLLTSIASATALLGAISAPAFASSTFHLVVPLKAQTQAQEPADPIAVSLAGAALPRATMNAVYSHSLQDYLAVTGDKALDKSAARWSLAEGTLPAGLALDEITGAVAGTPTVKTTSPVSFTVLSTYKGADGQAVYTLEVGGTTLEISQISLGAQHSCVITSAGGVKCWGDNRNSQLGNNSSESLSLTPVAVSGLDSGVASLSVGYRSNCALTANGVAKCWGLNNYGQLGDGTTTNRGIPVEVSGLGPVKQVSVGMAHACAVLMDDTVKCWGENAYGQLGIGSTLRVSGVQSAQGLADVASISAGQNHTCAALKNGTVKCWGWNTKGQLGDGSLTTRAAPASVNITDVLALSAGDYHTCALTSTGAKCWGANDYGQLGYGYTSSSGIKTPTAVKVADIQDISAGGLSTCALTTSGNVHCFGNNSTGALGDGTTTSRPTYTTVTLSGASAISAGQSYSCALRVDGSAKCWGQNNSGQLGNGATGGSLVPVDVQAIN